MMNISLLKLGAAAGAKLMGEVWQPKAQKHMVGRDVNALTQTSPVLQTDRDLVVAKSEDTRFTSREVFSLAKEWASGGGRVKNFRTVDTKELTQGAVSANDCLYKTKDRAVTFDGATLKVWSVTESGEIDEVLGEQKVNGDTRLVWGKDGDFSFKTGGYAGSTNGALTAESDNEIIIRKSEKDVVAGKNSIVVNLSDSAGTFSGGSGVTYLGAYGAGSTIAGGGGETDYAGYFNGAEIVAAEGPGLFSGVFENLTLDASDADNTFSGYFSKTAINGGKGKDVFRGMFLDGTTVSGGDGDDTFNGRFIDAILNGGAGNDKFGRGGNLDTTTVRTDGGGAYQGVEADFIDSEIDAGEGDDRFNGAMWGGRLSLGEGDNRVRGMFTEAEVLGGDGDDTIAAMYSKDSRFETGAGDDAISLATALTSSITTGEGANAISLGYNTDGSLTNDGAALGGDAKLSSTTWSTPEEYASGLAGVRFGEIAANSVNAAEGENIIRVDNGDGTQIVRAGDPKRAEEAAGAEDEPESENAAPVENADAASMAPLPSLASSLPEPALLAPPASYTMSEAERNKRERAIGRYAEVSGDGPRVEGGRGVSIDAGTGERIELSYAYRMRKEIEEKDPDGIRSFTRRHDAYTHRTGMISR